LVTWAGYGAVVEFGPVRLKSKAKGKRAKYELRKTARAFKVKDERRIAEVRMSSFPRGSKGALLT